MTKLLVNAPTGVQQIITVGEGGGYFDITRVLWDERTDGALPAITLGGMVRVDNSLILDETLLAQAIDDPEIASDARAKRNSLLAVTDFHAFTDNTLTAEMETYRQALRDISAQAGFPNTITWPTEPS